MFKWFIEDIKLHYYQNLNFLINELFFKKFVICSKMPNKIKKNIRKNKNKTPKIESNNNLKIEKIKLINHNFKKN